MDSEEGMVVHFVPIVYSECVGDALFGATSIASYCILGRVYTTRYCMCRGGMGGIGK